jgi:dihydroflavonol-4-reductase
VLAMTTPEAAGQRFVGSGDSYWMPDVAKILKQGLGDQARKVPFIPVPDFVARMAALFDPIVRGRLYELGKGDPFRRRRPSERWAGHRARSPRPSSTLHEAFRQAAWSERQTQ